MSARRTESVASPAIRAMTLDDVNPVLEMERLAFPGIPEERLWKPHQVAAHVERFPEGQWVAELDGRVVGSCTNMLTTWEQATAPHTWNGITAHGTLETHEPDGDVLYGTEVMVHPEARRRGIGRRLIEARFRLVRDRGLRAFVTGGRIPGYEAHADAMTPQQYVDAVVRGDLSDPVLTPELRWGFEPRGIHCGYLLDPPSFHHATLVVWENPERTTDG